MKEGLNRLLGLFFSGGIGLSSMHLFAEHVMKIVTYCGAIVSLISGLLFAYGYYKSEQRKSEMHELDKQIKQAQIKKNNDEES